MRANVRRGGGVGALPSRSNSSPGVRRSTRRARRRPTSGRFSAMILLATSFMVIRLSIAARWIHLNASGSVIPNAAISVPLARSTSLRVSSRSDEALHLDLERMQLGVPRQRDLDGRHQVALLERLHQVRHGAGRPGPLDQVALRERGQNHHRGDPLVGDLLGRRQAIHDRHFDVEDAQVGPQLLGQLHRRLAVTRLATDVVPLFDQHLAEVEPDQRLVLSDENPALRAPRSRSLPLTSMIKSLMALARGPSVTGTLSAATVPVFQPVEKRSSNLRQCGFESHRGHTP